MARRFAKRGGHALDPALAAIVAVGALLRFGTLGIQHFWLDEAVTAGLLRLDLHDMLGTMWTTESTPPLYYLLARGWAALVGTGEVGLRSLSALLGTVTIPIVYAIGAVLGSRRVGLIAAAIAALSPALVWYSQEARSYPLVILLCALSLLFAARAATGGRDRDVGWWAVSSVLAVASHYFAVFLVGGELIWLLTSYPRRRALVIAAGVVAAGGAALLPLAIHQSGEGNLEFISDTPLGTRLVDTVQLFLGGPTGERVAIAIAVLATAVVLGGIAVLRAPPRERGSALALVGIAALGIGAAVLLALLGLDYVLARNLLPLWIPLAAALALGLGAERNRPLAIGAAAGLAAGSLWLLAAVPLDRSLQREAITAELLPVPADPERHRLDPHVGFALGRAGETVSARTACDPGYRILIGGATIRHGGRSERLHTRPERADGASVGERASARVDADGTVVQAYDVCTRPRD